MDASGRSRRAVADRQWCGEYFAADANHSPHPLPAKGRADASVPHTQTCIGNCAMSAIVAKASFPLA